jgi:hypothetical protein
MSKSKITLKPTPTKSTKTMSGRGIAKNVSVNRDLVNRAGSFDRVVSGGSK